MIIRYIEKLSVSRPLVFLCGPYYDPKNPKDRRLILRNWIDKNWTERGAPTSGDKIHAYPIVIDDLLNVSTIASRGLKVNLVEEILSRCAYRTYIFLDTMSTSYEFGEFTNYAFGEHAVRVFLDEEYASRINCPIGDYLKLSIGNGLNTYVANYNAKGYLFFPNDKLPSEIIKIINQDSPLLPSYKRDYPIQFVSAAMAAHREFGLFSYRQIAGTGFEFIADPKTWFYFMSLVQSKNIHIDLANIHSPADRDYQVFMSLVKQEASTSFCCMERTMDKPGFFLGNNSVKLSCSVFGEEFFYHAATLLGIIKQHAPASPTGVSYISQLPNEIGRFSCEGLDFYFPSYKRLLARIDKSESVIQNGVKSKTLTIKSKKRNIICYAPNKYGHDLRALHSAIQSVFLSILPTSIHSFAYKEGQNTLSCLKQHEGNLFFAKFDISKYFESITRRSVLKKCLALIQTSREEKTELGAFRLCRISLEVVEKEIDKILKPLFFSRLSHDFGGGKYKSYLPIGYASSPKISDFYLRDLDEMMGSTKGLKYTRYADDILLSSNDQKLLEEGCLALRNALKMEDLEINEKKVMKKSLANIGDSIHFLGINLVRREEGYSYTISQRYLLETSKMVERSLRKDALFSLKVTGRINYIKFVSPESFEKLKRIITKKLGYIPSIVD